MAIDLKVGMVLGHKYDMIPETLWTVIAITGTKIHINSDDPTKRPVILDVCSPWFKSVKVIEAPLERVETNQTYF